SERGAGRCLRRALSVLQRDLLAVAAERVLRPVGELLDDDRGRCRRDDRERDPEPPANADEAPGHVLNRRLRDMPEGDSLHRVAAQLQVLVGQRIEVETPHPRAAVKRLAERLDGRTLERVEAEGKNLYLTFSGGLVLRSHLRMNGRWRVETRDAVRR